MKCKNCGREVGIFVINIQKYFNINTQLTTYKPTVQCFHVDKNGKKIHYKDCKNPRHISMGLDMAVAGGDVTAINGKILKKGD